MALLGQPGVHDAARYRQVVVANARQLDATSVKNFAPIAERLSDLDMRLDSLMSRAGAGGATAAELAEQLRQGLAIRAVADSLNAAIERAAEERRASIGNYETRDQVLTAVLLLFGLVAAFMVARLGTTFRALALRLDESEARFRQVAESRQRLVRGFTHDVKNPLGAADGYLALLEDGVMGKLAEQHQTDAMRVRQVVGNLVSNAVKYTPAGGHLAVRVTSLPSHLEIAVTDDGAGIPEDKRAQLFTEFARFDPGAAEGAGIGLAISQHIAHALGGEIVVRSAAGAGSTFTLRLPVR